MLSSFVQTNLLYQILPTFYEISEYRFQIEQLLLIIYFSIRFHYSIYPTGIHSLYPSCYERFRTTIIFSTKTTTFYPKIVIKFLDDKPFPIFMLTQFVFRPTCLLLSLEKLLNRKPPSMNFCDK